MHPKCQIGACEIKELYVCFEHYKKVSDELLEAKTRIRKLEDTFIGPGESK